MIVVVSADERWRAPLEAMLAVRGVDARVVADPLDAVAEVRAGGVLALVLHVGDGDDAADDAALALRSVRRRARVAPWTAVVGEGAAGMSGVDYVATNPFAYAELVDAIEGGARRGPMPATGGPGAPPYDVAELEQLARRCRHEDYFAILDVRRDAEPDAILPFASRLLERLDATEAAALPDAARPLVAEARETIEDARDVLTSPRARALYEQG